MKIPNHDSSNLQIKQTAFLFANVLEFTMCIVYGEKKKSLSFDCSGEENH